MVKLSSLAANTYYLFIKYCFEKNGVQIPLSFFGFVHCNFGFDSYRDFGLGPGICDEDFSKERSGHRILISIHCNEVGLSEHTLRLIGDFVQILRQSRLQCAVWVL